MRLKDEKKEIQILESTIRIVSKTGLSGLRMSDVAKESKIATGTVYIYYSDKHSLLKGVYLYLSKDIIKDFSVGIKDLDSLKTKINKISFNYLQSSIVYPERGIFFEQYMRSPFQGVGEDLLKEETDIYEPILKLIVRGQNENILKDIDPELIMNVVCGILDSTAKIAIFENKTIRDIDWDNLFALIWDAIKK
ncbi:MAG: TetR/AcrR family transcriptional regulator [Leadbetterella sp.]